MSLRHKLGLLLLAIAVLAHQYPDFVNNAASYFKSQKSFTDEFRVLFVAERGTEPDYWDGAVLRNYLQSHAAAADGNPGFRILAPADDVSRVSKWEQMAMALPRESTPTVICGKKNMVYMCAPPDTADELVTFLSNHGGGK
jgi:hypothetical protein